MTHFQTQQSINMTTALPCQADAVLGRQPRLLSEAAAALPTSVLGSVHCEKARHIVLSALHTSVEKVYRANSYGEVAHRYTVAEIVALRLLVAVHEYRATIDDALADDNLYGAAFARVERNAQAKLRRVERRLVGQTINLRHYI